MENVGYVGFILEAAQISIICTTLKKKTEKLGIVRVCNSSTEETEAGVLCLRPVWVYTRS